MGHRIIETIRLIGHSQQYTGEYRLVGGGEGEIPSYIDLPGRGGRVTKKAAKLAETLWAQGYSVGEIETIVNTPKRRKKEAEKHDGDILAKWFSHLIAD